MATHDCEFCLVTAAERDDANRRYQWMVDRAADAKLDGYREIAQRAADAENIADELRAELARTRAELSAMETRLAHAVEMQRLRRAKLHERLVAVDKTVQEVRLEAHRARTVKMVATRMLAIKRELVAKVEAERDRALDMVRVLLDSAYPHPIEHPTMWAAWEKARALLGDPK